MLKMSRLVAVFLGFCGAGFCGAQAQAQQLPSIPSNFDVNQWLQPMGIPPSMGGDPLGAFRFTCWPSHLAYDDPIVNPGQVGGAGHLHQFFGNTLTNANSTYESLRTTGDGSCSGGPLNRSAYWMPAMLDGTGNVVAPDLITVYYKGLPGSKELPNGLRYVFGADHHDPTSAANAQPVWSCVSAGHPTSSGNTIAAATVNGCPASVIDPNGPSSRPYSVDSTLNVAVASHDCWDGVNLDSPNHRSHMARRVNGRCPSTHPVEIPSFIVTAAYRIHQGDNVALWRLSSDDHHGAPGSTFHVDWFGAWDDDVRRRWDTACIDGHLSSTSGNLCDGQGLRAPMDFYTFFPSRESRRFPLPQRPALPDSPLTVPGDATLQIPDGGVNASMGSLAGAGSVIIGGGSSLTVGSNNLSTVFFGDITGNGSFNHIGTGTLTLTGGANAIGGTLCNCAGVLDINGGAFTVGGLTQVLGGMLAVTNRGTLTVGGPTQIGGDNAGFMTILGGGRVNSRAGATIDAVNGTSMVIVSGSGSTWNVDNGLAVGNALFGGLGNLTIADGGVVNSTGPTTIGRGSALNLGNGGLAGTINTATITNDGQIIANFTDTATFNPVIDGIGSLTKQGSGTMVLTTVHSYSGQTTVNGGGLIVNGSIASSSGLTVNGGFVGGTGTLPSTTVANDGTLSPGNSIGTITIAGNLAFVGAGNYVVELSPTDADRTNVTGTATLAGTVQAVFAPGGYVVARSYTILSATGGLTGSFGSLTTTDLPTYFITGLSYTATDVLLNLTLGLGQLPALNTNQQAVASTLDAAFNSGVLFTGEFGTLLTMPASSMPQALTQLSGEIATGAATAGFRATDQFLGLMLDPFMENRAGGAPGNVGGPALAFAAEPDRNGALADAEARVRKAPLLAPTFEQRWTGWGAAYGGHGAFDGDAAIGSNALIANTAGVAGGVDYRFGSGVIGAAVTGQSLSYRLGAGLGSGSGDAVQAGLYGSTGWHNAYVSAAVSVGWYELDSDRTIRLPGLTDRLTADFSALSLGGRIEGGYRVPVLQSSGVTPYAALQALSFHTGAYAETDAARPNAFALVYAANTSHDVRSELGLRFDTRMALGDTSLLILRGRAAWAHAFDDDRSINALFQKLPLASFTVFGASAAENSALLSAGGELRLANGLSLLAKVDGEFGGDSEIYAGRGTLRYTW